MNDLTPEEAVTRLERSGGWVTLRARVRASGALFYEAGAPTYRFQGRQDGVAIITDPAGHRWQLETDTDRASLIADMGRIKDDANTHSREPGLVWVLEHHAELDEAGYGQIGCALAVPSTVVGFVLGLPIAWLIDSEAAMGAAVIGAVVGLVVGFFMASGVVGPLTRIPALRDHQLGDIFFGYTAIAPGLLTFLIAIILAAASGR